jgi:serine/threonine-protein kinase
MLQAAEHSYRSIADPLLAAVESEAPNAVIERAAGHGKMSILATLGRGKLGMSVPAQEQPWNGPFAVIAHAVISVNQNPARGHQGRSHSLWFCDAQEEGRFAWYELAFMNSPLSGGPSLLAPFSLDPEQATVAFQGVIGTTQLAWPVEEIDRSDPTEFIDRWLGWFGEAAEGQMQHPSRMPEKPTAGSWRRSRNA